MPPSDAQKEAIGALFDRIDAIHYKDGSASADELKTVFGEFAGEFMQFCDKNEDQKISKDEFCNGIVDNQADASEEDFQAQWIDRMEGVVAAAEALPIIGLINPQAYMSKYIEELRARFNIRIINPDETNFEPDYIKEWADKCRGWGIAHVCGLAQKDSWHHALINRELGHVSISALGYLIAMNKFMQRVIEPKAFWFDDCDPMAEDDDTLAAKVDNANEWPCMLKNTSLSLGNGVFRIKNKERMQEILAEYRANTDLQAGIKHTNDSIIQYFTDEDRAMLEAAPVNGRVPPFLFEHCVDLSLGWIEYCYEGCITEDGTLHHYGFTEEFYSEEAIGLAYLTPPGSFPVGDTYIDQLEAYVSEYMEQLISRGYRRQFFNIEIWGRKLPDEEKLEFCFCEINPRCAHAYHIPYQIAYKTNLWGDNFNLVLNDTPSDNTPWKCWRNGNFKYSVQVLINIIGEQWEGKCAGDILDYAFVDHIDSKVGDNGGTVELVRHVKQRDYVITSDDAKAGAGCTLLQIFQACECQSEAVAMEIAIRQLTYKPEGRQSCEYPAWWRPGAEEYGVDNAIAKLTAGM